MFHTAISVSDEFDPLTATQEVISGCRKQMSPAVPQVGILVTSCMEADFRQMLEEVTRAFPGIKLLGCTTDGEICPDHGFVEDSVGLLLLASDIVEFGTAVAEDISDSLGESFAGAYQECRDQLSAEPSCGLVFPDGITTVGIELERLIRSACGDQIPIFGGGAGDRDRFARSYQFYGTRVLTDSVPILLFGGPIEAMGMGMHGWTPIGRHYPVNSVEKNRAYTIDGVSAREFYRAHLGPQVPIISHIPLAVYNGESDEFFLREALTVDEEDGSIEFIGSYPGNARVRFTTVFREDMISAADLVNATVLSANGGMPDLVIVFSCTTRRHILGSQTKSELRILREQSDIPFFGFYCYGEYCPITPGGMLECQSDSYVAIAFKVTQS